MTTEADNGLTFGARLRHQATSVNGAGYGGGFNGARFFARAGGLEIGVGNTFGAIEFMPGVYMSTQSADIGLSGLGFHSLVTNTAQKGYFNWDAYSSGGVGRDGVEVMYSAGDFWRSPVLLEHPVVLSGPACTFVTPSTTGPLPWVTRTRAWQPKTRSS